LNSVCARAVTYGQEHHRLAVLDLAGDAGMLSGHPDADSPLRHLRGLIQHQDRLRVAQMGQDEALQQVKHHPPIPPVLSQQRLHPPRRGVPGLLAQLPA
jgi:hypothetical protein